MLIWICLCFVNFIPCIVDLEDLIRLIFDAIISNKGLKHSIFFINFFFQNFGGKKITKMIKTMIATVS